MKVFGKLLAALAATTALTGVANAETTFSGNVALVSDYTFRGISQTNEAPAIQGGFDVSSGMFYAGTWGSSIDFGAGGNLELDLYAGLKPEVGPVTLDFGVIAYLYPSASDDASELDFYEAKAAASISPTEQVSLGGALFYSPEFTLDGGDSLYAEVSGSFAASETLSFSAAYGNQSVDTAGYFAGEDSYSTWNVGGTLSVAGFGLDLRYVDTDFDAAIGDGRVVLAVKRSL